jgi:hypothetical protein
MYKHVILLNIKNLANELPAFERWYAGYHAPEAVGTGGPWLTRYLGYRALPVIPEAEAYGYYNWRVTEMWAREVEPYGSRGKGSVISKRFPNQIERQGCPGAEFGQVEWWGGPDFRQNVHLTVPARPTEDFHGPFYAEYERSILRWFIVMKYPEGVPVDEGEDWYLNVHAKEAARQPGLDRYFSHRAVDTPGAPAQYPWVRLVEQWYENFDAWKKAVIDSPPAYTKPPWAKYDKYPFLEPFVDFCSTFLLETPTNDWLRDTRPYLYV